MDRDLVFCLNDFAKQFERHQRQLLAGTLHALSYGSLFKGAFPAITVGAAAGILGAPGGLSSNNASIFGTSEEQMNEEWNRIYHPVTQEVSDNNAQRIYWDGSINRDGKPYFYPKGQFTTLIIARDD